MPDYEVKQPDAHVHPIFWKDPSLEVFTPDAIGVEIRTDDAAAPLLVNGVNVMKELKRARFHLGILSLLCVGLIAWNIVHLFINHT
jgi:hypothetical protein